MSDDPRRLLARYLAQRRTLGWERLVLEDRPAAELLAALRPLPPSPASAATAHPGGEPTLRESLARIGSLEELAAVAVRCTRCRLAATRQHVVVGEGPSQALVAVVGEAPGGEEDRTGRPFVGPAGRLLDQLLESVGLPREEVYICNVLKCRPPNNRNPYPDEIDACRPYLERQLELVAPHVVLAAGTFAAQTLLGTNLPIGRLRGHVHRTTRWPVVPTYHPAALLRNRSWIRAAWEDLQRLRAVLDERLADRVGEG